MMRHNASDEEGLVAHGLAMMQFLTVSDEVSPAIYSLRIRERFGNAHAALACGDLPYYYLEFIVTMLRVPCFFIYGNHDGAEHTADGQTLFAPGGCICLEGRSICFEGILIAGLGGSLRYNQGAGAQYTQAQMQARTWLLIPQLLLNRLRYGRYLDILLTHAPPYGIHNGPDRPHQGFRAFLRIMDRFSPHYLVHGHIHHRYGFSRVTQTRYRQTIVLNAVGYRLLTLDQPAPIQTVHI